jgi:hypothetical protein
MASLKDVEKVADELGGMVEELKSSLGDGDFDRLVQLSDDISERADGLAETFGNINETLMSRLKDGGNGGSGRSRQRSQSGRKSGGNGED